MDTPPEILAAMLAIFSDQADASEAAKLKADIAGRMQQA